MGRAFLALALLLAACKAGGGDSGGAPQDGVMPKGPPPQLIANGLGFCDDVARCTIDCNAKDGDACRRLAVTYEFGKADAGRDETLGTTYYDRSCALGNAAGCVSSGQMHEYGHGVPKDAAFAAGAYARACTLGWQVGCANWAIMLENGRGVDRDEEKAKVLYDGACKAGAGLACERLKALSAKGTSDAAP